MEIKLFRRTLELRSAFRIAHGSYSCRESVFLWLREGRHVGMGEAPRTGPFGFIAGPDLAAEIEAMPPLGARR